VEGVKFYGGFVASPAHLESLQASLHPGLPVPVLTDRRKSALPKSESSLANRWLSSDSIGESLAHEVFAHGVEFIALPGETEKLQKEIPVAMREVNRNSKGFSGSMVLFSEQEARLVTVITLWTGSEPDKECDENSTQLKRLLEPYVDRWLRTRKFVTFVSTP
jgi:hypothetical protein